MLGLLHTLVYSYLVFLKYNKRTIMYLSVLRELLTKVCVCTIPERQIIRPILILEHITPPQSWKLFQMDYIHNAFKKQNCNRGYSLIFTLCSFQYQFFSHLMSMYIMQMCITDVEYLPFYRLVTYNCQILVFFHNLLLIYNSNEVN